jgi:2',3'-cyclic-nucleotide 2'-phosphodiesterase/3'-nucleotidase
MKIHILSTSDVHGYIYPTNFAGDDNAPFGLSRAKTAIDEFKKQHSNDAVFVVDNGDFIQGSPMTNFIARDHNEYIDTYQKLADTMEYDARTLGNHEFNYGADYLKKAVPDSNQIVDANVTRDDSLFYKQPYKIIERNGVKVGFLGLTTEFISVWENESHIPNMTFEDVIDVAKTLIPKMREEGAQVIVVMYHAGFESDLKTGEATEMYTAENRAYALLQEVDGIDALVTGHQHRVISALINTPFGIVPTTQPGQKAQYVGEISLDFEDGKIISSDAQLIETKDYEPATEITAIVRNIQKELNQYLDTVIGEFDKDYLYKDHYQARMKNHPIVDLVNRIQGESVNTTISANAIFNDEVPGFKKEITRRDIVINYLYPNTVVAEEIYGKELLEALEQSATFFTVEEDGSFGINTHFTLPKMQLYNYDIYSGIDYTIDLTKPMGSRIVKAMTGSGDIDPNKKYRVAVSNFRANGTGDYTMYSMDKAVDENFNDMAQLLEDYIIKNTPLTLREPNNIHIIK